MAEENRAPVKPIGDEELELLKSAEQALLPGPWLVWDDGDIGTAYGMESFVYDRVRGVRVPSYIESKWIFNGYNPASQAVVDIRNGLPGLLERLRIAEAELERLRAENADLTPPF